MKIVLERRDFCVPDREDGLNDRTSNLETDAFSGKDVTIAGRMKLGKALGELQRLSINCDGTICPLTIATS